MARETAAEPRGLYSQPAPPRARSHQPGALAHRQGFARELLDERFARAPMKAGGPAAGGGPRLRRHPATGHAGRRARGVFRAAARRARPGVRQVLRLGVYQMLFQERVPQHAIVDESVRLARATGKSRATGFVNAVLRSIGRDLSFAAEPDPARPQHSFEIRPGRACVLREKRPAAGGFRRAPGRRALVPGRADAALAGALRHLARARAPPGERAAAALRPAERAADFDGATDRAPRRRAGRGAPVAYRPHAAPSAADASRRGCAAFREGLFQVQDDSSAAVAPFLGRSRAQNVLDLCAAPGGKACHMAERMQNRGMIAAVDDSGRRLERLVENVQRLDLRIIATVESDGATFARQHPGKFDRVLLDAPCSNTGVLRRRVEARWRLLRRGPGRLAAQQRALLAAALHSSPPRRNAGLQHVQRRAGGKCARRRRGAAFDAGFPPRGAGGIPARARRRRRAVHGKADQECRMRSAELARQGRVRTADPSFVALRATSEGGEGCGARSDE